MQRKTALTAYRACCEKPQRLTVFYFDSYNAKWTVVLNLIQLHPALLRLLRAVRFPFFWDVIFLRMKSSRAWSDFCHHHCQYRSAGSRGRVALNLLLQQQWIDKLLSVGTGCGLSVVTWPLHCTATCGELRPLTAHWRCLMQLQSKCVRWLELSSPLPKALHSQEHRSASDAAQ